MKIIGFGKSIRTTHLVYAGHFIALSLIVSTCDLRNSEVKLSGVVHYSGQEFAGTETCSPCHPSIADAHRVTAHSLTSAPASIENVKGSFDSGENVFKLSEQLKIMMRQSPSGLFQAGFVNGVQVEMKPIDITIGSGRKGQTYLYWENNALFQLPVSYYSPLDTWCNSPGYPPDHLVFNRSVTARCLECHSTFFRMTKAVEGRETFDRNQVMLGVSCERCHGPAGDHVTFHTRNPGERKPRHIASPQQLTRQQRLDNCALCHSGLRQNFMPSFTFTVGDNLEDFSYPDSSPDNASLDVHGNQYGLLSASKCFRLSKMDCSSCHNVHEKETNNLGLFSSRCMSCHSREAHNYCTQPEVPGLVLSKNCIDCHMPALPSRKVFLQAPDSLPTTPFLIRTHFISTAYKDQVKAFLDAVGTTDNR